MQWETLPFQHLVKEWLTFVATVRGKATDRKRLKAPAGWHIDPGKKSCDSKYHTNNLFNHMSSETNMRIKSPRNAEVKGTESNLCKNVEVLGTKALQGPTWLNVKCVFGKNVDKSYHLCASTGKANSRWRTETIPVVKLCLYFSISSLIFSLGCILLGGMHALSSWAGHWLYRSVLALAVKTLMRAELQVLQRMCPSNG